MRKKKSNRLLISSGIQISFMLLYHIQTEKGDSTANRNFNDNIGLICGNKFEYSRDKTS
jgi:hypothetical protein